MAKKKDTTNKKESTVAQDKKKATRKKKDVTAEKVKASPIKKTITTEKPKTVKEIVSTKTVEEQPVNVPTHIGGVKLSDRLINLLRRQASNK